MNRVRPALGHLDAPLLLRAGDGVEVAVRRHPRARRLRLSVDERGARLTLPVRATVADAQAFLDTQHDWLRRHLHARARPDIEFIPGEATELPLRGEQLPIHWGSGRLARVAHAGHGIEICTGARANAGALHRALADYYLAEARADVARWLPAYLPGLDKAPVRIEFRQLRSLWGSLSPRDVVKLDLALVLGRPSAFEYVLVHELCHLLHRNHSPAYWAEVQARFPHWKHERDYLREHGLQLKRQLQAITCKR